jgi:hypothetical protein
MPFDRGAGPDKRSALWIVPAMLDGLIGAKPCGHDISPRQSLPRFVDKAALIATTLTLSKILWLYIFHLFKIFLNILLII